jgi:hypothetical protein
LTQTHPFLASAAALREFVNSWERHTLPQAQWTHAAHVAVCAFYTAEFSPTEALRRMREGIPPYNISVGGQNTEDSGYHKTLACLWAKIIGDFLSTAQHHNTFAAPDASGFPQTKPLSKIPKIAVYLGSQVNQLTF